MLLLSLLCPLLHLYQRLINSQPFCLVVCALHVLMRGRCEWLHLW